MPATCSPPSSSTMIHYNAEQMASNTMPSIKGFEVVLRIPTRKVVSTSSTLPTQLWYDQYLPASVTEGAIRTP